METGRCQFGSRYLTDESLVFQHNAWDNVEWKSDDEAEASKVISEQRKQQVNDDDAKKLIGNPSEKWDRFYSKHDNKFFMNRNWLMNEFTELDTSNREDNVPLRVLEVGCGVGNSIFPLLETCKPGQLFIYACDYSPIAIDILQKNANYDSSTCHSFVWDICGEPTKEIEEGSLDIILCIYILSAIPPKLHQIGVNNLVRLLKPGGILLLKDYGLYDLTQLRFKADRLIKDNFYCRGDGTLVYFFTQDELNELFSNAGLTKELNVVDRRLIVNRAKLIKMRRVWLQCKYRKTI